MTSALAGIRGYLLFNTGRQLGQPHYVQITQKKARLKSYDFRVITAGQLKPRTPHLPTPRHQVSIVIAVCCAFLNQNQWPSFLLLDWRPTLLKLQLWRLVTPFLFLGPLGVNFVLTTHFSWTYMSQLEKLHYREPHTFVMLLVFGMSRFG